MAKQYEMAFSIGAKVQGSFGSAFRNAASSIQGLQSTIDQLNKKQSDISSYQKTQQALENVTSKLKLYQQQYANLEAEMEKNGQASAAEQNAMLAKAKAIDDLKAKQEQLQGKLASTGQALENEGVDLSNLGKESTDAANQVETLRKKQEDLATSSQNADQAVGGVAESLMNVMAAAGVTKVIKEIGDAFKQCASEAIAFENSMAAVKRTVGGSDEFIGELGESFKDLSTEIPITASELAQIASTAGQLGIAQDKVEQFSTVMAKLATTTDLTADEAATMLAQFANITGITDYERMGAVVAQLGDSTATTASKVVQMSQGMAAAATLAGMSSTDIMAISASLGSLGIEAQAGATSMSQLINTLYKATETGEKLNEFASVAGMTAEQFKQAWASDAVGAMNSFITGLNDVERNGRSAIVILDELGISNVRQQKAILGLASAGDLLSNSITMANSAWEQNTALEEKASVMYETTQAKLTTLGNAFSNMKIAIGDAFLPIIKDVSEALTSAMKPVTDFIQQNPQLVKAIGTAIAVIGGVSAALAAYTIAAKVATAASAALTAAIPGAKLIMGITAGVALLAGAFVAFSGSTEEATQSLEEIDAEFDEINNRIRHDNEIIDLADKYEKLSTQVDHAVDTTKKMEDFDDINISVGATAEPSIDPNEFVLDSDVTVEGIAEESVYAEDLLIDKDNYVDINGEIGDTLVDASDLVTNTVDGAGQVYIDGLAGNAVNTDELIEGDGTTDINGQVGNQVDTNELISGNGLTPINGFPNEHVDTSELITGDGQAEINGYPGTQVDTDDLVAGDGEAQINGTPGSTVSPDDLVDTDENGNHGIKLTASPQEGILLDVNAFVNDDREVKFTAQWDNKPQMEEDIAAFKQAALDAKSELETAKSDLADVEKEIGYVESQLTHAPDEQTKSALRSELEELNGVLTTQKSTVDKLTEEYEDAAAKYIITSNAADALSRDSEELIGIQEALGIKTGDVTNSLVDETGAIRDQAKAIRDKAEADREAAKISAYDTMLKESEAFAKHWAKIQSSASTITTYRADLVRLQGEMDNYSTSTSAQLENALNDVNKIYDKYVTFAGDYFLWDELNQSEKNKFFKLQQMMKDLTGLSWAADDFVRYDVQEKVREQIVSLEDLEEEYVMTSQAIDSLTSNQKDSQQSIETYITTLSDAIAVGAMTKEQLRQRLERQFADVEDGAEMIEYIMSGVEASISGAAEAAEDLGDNVSTALNADQVSEQVQPIIDKMYALEEAYNAAYDAAYKSLSGQFDLFEDVELAQASDNAQEVVEGYIESLNHQRDYIAQYQANWNQLKKDGLNEALLEQLSDGSTESAQILAELVAGGAGKIKELNTAFEQVEEGKKSFSEEIAEMETDFSEKMKILQGDLADTIAKMDMSSDAASAASSTMDAFAAAAEGKTDTVRTAFAKVAAAAKAALQIDIDGDGYASGTESATPGFHIVGEHGPEMVFMNGGEKVLDATETAQAMENMALSSQPVNAMSGSNGGYIIEFSPQYNISGSANTEETRSMLETTSIELRNQLEDLLDDIENDRARRKYA